MNAMAALVPPKTSPTETAASFGDDIDTIVPLLFATNPGFVLNYHEMSNMDQRGRTASASEDTFSKWRETGLGILATHTEEAGSSPASGQLARMKKQRIVFKKAMGADDGGIPDSDESLHKIVDVITSPREREASSNTLDEPASKKTKGSQEEKRSGREDDPIILSPSTSEV